MSGPAALTLPLLLAAGAARGDGVRCPVEGGVVFADLCGEGIRARDSAGQPDHTEVLQAALNTSGAHTVVLRNLSSPTPWVAAPLYIDKGDRTLRFEANAFLHAKRGRDCRRAGARTCFWQTGASMLTVRAERNVTIEGQPGATIRMWKQDYLNRSEYQKAEWRMGIYLGNHRNFN